MKILLLLMLPLFGATHKKPFIPPLHLSKITQEQTHKSGKYIIYREILPPIVPIRDKITHRYRLNFYPLRSSASAPLMKKQRKIPKKK